MNIYYKIWVDCILQAQSKPQNKTNWKFFTLLFMSITMAVNLLTLMAIIQRNIFHQSFYNIDINFFSNQKINSFFSFIILFLLPPLFLNILLIFRKNRYKKLIKRYEYYKGRLFMSYFLSSFILPLLLLLIGYFIENYF